MRPTALRNRLFGGVLALALTAPIAARAELRVVDRTPQKGAFSLTNSTGTTIRYQVRWGNQNAWKPMTLESGRVMTHSHPLSAERRADAVCPLRQDRRRRRGDHSQGIPHRLPCGRRRRRAEEIRVPIRAERKGPRRQGATLGHDLGNGYRFAAKIMLE
jgi:hypothetical protein